MVVEEAMKGDVGAAQRRIQIIEGLPLLEIDEETIRLTDMILHTNVIPPKAAADAAHIALASRHAMDYLLTRALPATQIAYVYGVRWQSGAATPLSLNTWRHKPKPCRRSALPPHSI